MYLLVKKDTKTIVMYHESPFVKLENSIIHPEIGDASWIGVDIVTTGSELPKDISSGNYKYIEGKIVKSNFPRIVNHIIPADAWNWNLHVGENNFHAYVFEEYPGYLYDLDISLDILKASDEARTAYEDANLYGYSPYDCIGGSCSPLNFNSIVCAGDKPTVDIPIIIKVVSI